MRILVVGLGGFMGREVAALAQSGCCGAELAGGVDPNGSREYPDLCVKTFDEAESRVDCVVDFSHHSDTAELVGFAKKHSLPLVIATTGQTEEELALIHEAAESIPVFFAANYSLGVALLVEMAKRTASLFPNADVEIVETHHNRKIDAPSGTALTLAREIASVRENANITTGRSGMGARRKGDIGVQSVRMGNIAGIHEVHVCTAYQTITLRHEAHSRALFAEGALTAAAWLLDRPAGLYDMKDLMRI